MAKKTKKEPEKLGLNVLKKPNSRTYFTWKFDKELELWYLQKFKNKDNKLEETKMIAFNDKNDWENYLINQGYNYQQI